MQIKSVPEIVFDIISESTVPLFAMDVLYILQNRIEKGDRVNSEILFKRGDKYNSQKLSRIRNALSSLYKSKKINRVGSVIIKHTGKAYCYTSSLNNDWKAILSSNNFKSEKYDLPSLIQEAKDFILAFNSNLKPSEELIAFVLLFQNYQFTVEDIKIFLNNL